MHTYVSPSGNFEVWEHIPSGYYTIDEWQAAHPSPAPMPPTSEQLFTSLRVERDVRLASTDKMLLPDYPISADALEQIKVYRSALRALPEQAGAPWDGGGELTPWPEKPNF